jgi:dephospho-CoA kinase
VYLIGISGNIATGKSTIDAMLAAKGAQVLDADAVTRHLQRKDEPVWQRIVERFGRDILGPDGELDRAKLGQLVFADPVALRDLELIVHPVVRDEEKRRIAEAQPGSVLAIDAIKLFESGMADACNTVWVVTAAPERQLERLQRQRGLATEVAWQRIRAQPPQEDKVRRAGVVIRNDGSLDETRRQVDEAWERTVGAWLRSRSLS